MRRHFIALLFLFVTDHSFSQTDSIEAMFAFRITDYTVKLNDSVTVVQVALPDASSLFIKEGQVAVLRHQYENGVYDSSIIGWGRCNLIKSRYYYFTTHKYHTDEPAQGNLLYTKCKVPVVYTELLFNIGRHAITLTKVDESQFYYGIDIFSTITKEKESEILDSMAADIRFTGKQMMNQSPDQNMNIAGGVYDGKKLFDAMQEVKREDVASFLRFMIAKPAKYAGNVWKISEVFATWMINKAPVIKED